MVVMVEVVVVMVRTVMVKFLLLTVIMMMKMNEHATHAFFLCHTYCLDQLVSTIAC